MVIRERARHAEVGDASDPVRPDEDIWRRHVAVHEVQELALTVGELVRGVEPGERVEEDPELHAEGDRRSALRCRPDQRRERRALNVLHHQEEAELVLEDVDRPDHVGVAHARREPRFVEEHPHELRIGCQVRVHHLDGDDALEAAHAEDAPEVHGGHAARGDLSQRLVATAPQGHWREGNKTP